MKAKTIYELFQQLESHNDLSVSFDMNDAYMLRIEFSVGDTAVMPLRPENPCFRSYKEFHKYFTDEYYGDFCNDALSASLNYSAIKHGIVFIDFVSDGYNCTFVFVLERDRD